MVEYPIVDHMSLDKTYNSSSVRQIIVDEAYWSPGVLDWLVLCTKLEHFSIKMEFESHLDEILDSEKFDASLFRKLLLPSATTLRTLRICYGKRYRDQLEYQDAEDVPFGTFSDFVVMEDITVRHSHLIGRVSHDSTDHWDSKPPAKIFPRSLKRIEITDVVEGHQLQLVSQLSELVEGSCCPNLEAVVLHLDIREEYTLIDELNCFNLECEARDIVLNVQVQYHY
ncbi:hypothetical protein N7509_004448 [Penicillium cosmopolitanum]|uniref:Uncharacterized protein n=1 Tax=Penicillium cosmopolitanum TaxID=1131564 RepID=A0A9X0BCG5_9EURO|nr:uncharacterized protein N7509_004448 [Penicillium cosmopolitanum]KAJ5404577.1 hypothetical protein N7509_004448 [Penicillium cosmopolitanum]